MQRGHSVDSLSNSSALRAMEPVSLSSSPPSLTHITFIFTFLFLCTGDGPLERAVVPSVRVGIWGRHAHFWSFIEGVQPREVQPNARVLLSVPKARWSLPGHPQPHALCSSTTRSGGSSARISRGNGAKRLTHFCGVKWWWWQKQGGGGLQSHRVEE